jgi:hypothetical protein
MQCPTFEAELPGYSHVHNPTWAIQLFQQDLGVQIILPPFIFLIPSAKSKAKSCYISASTY